MSILVRSKSALARLHRDESGRETVETILLLAVALVVLVVLVLFVKWGITYFKEKSNDAKSNLGDLNR